MIPISMNCHCAENDANKSVTFVVVRSRFVFHHRPDEEEEEEGEENEEIKESVAVLDQFDEDGDLVVKRRCVRQETSVINIGMYFNMPH